MTMLAVTVAVVARAFAGMLVYRASYSWRFAPLVLGPSIITSLLLYCCCMAAKWYSEYVRTEHWERLRKLTYAAAGYACSNPWCRARGQLVCHHLTYERLGHERLSDLSALCSTCHDAAHRTRRPPYMIEIISRPQPPVIVAMILRQELMTLRQKRRPQGWGIARRSRRSLRWV